MLDGLGWEYNMMLPSKDDSIVSCVMLIHRGDIKKNPNLGNKAGGGSPGEMSYEKVSSFSCWLLERLEPRKFSKVFEDARENFWMN